MKYLCKTFERRKPGWLTILNNWNICIFRVTLRHFKEKKSIKLYINALITVQKGVPGPQNCAFCTYFSSSILEVVESRDKIVFKI